MGRPHGSSVASYGNQRQATRKEIALGAKPAIYFVVYPDKANAEKPKVQVEFLSNGRSVASQVAELPPPDATGAIPVMVGAAALPGECELRITAMQGATSATESVRYKVAD